MDEEIAKRLNRLNREFYDAFAGAFAGSRGRSEPGLEKVLTQVFPGSRILDLGCAHGRIAQLLPERCRYTGVDFSQRLIGLARQGPMPETIQTQFIVADLVSQDWPEMISGKFDWIFIRAVLHHIPGYETRLRILRQACSLLSAEGRVVMANWQFLAVPRLRRRIQPWTRVDLTVADVEQGDYLLDWRRDGQGFRYVHLVDEPETLRLAQDAGMVVETLFRADGREGNLTLYAILVLPPTPGSMASSNPLQFSS
ncbi:MAG: class I SAM-dependent methyltransferase [Anaerolineae bacterium]|nr:class I SAM-dependent methyltransferase [Anaerolineae bacterium]